MAEPPKPPRPSVPDVNVALREYHERTHGSRVAHAAHAEVRRRQSDAAFEMQATLAAIMVHLERRDAADARREAAQNATLAVLARELGVEADVPREVVSSIPPPPDGAAKRAQPLVPRIGHDARQTRTGMIVMLLITLLTFLNHAIEFASKHL